MSTEHADDIATMDALNGLAKAIPDWHVRLDDLNGQIAQRQIELAQLTESQRSGAPAVRSVRNRGSTESLRQRDNNSSPQHSDDDDELATFAQQRLQSAPQISVVSPTSPSRQTPPIWSRTPDLKASNSLPSTPQRAISNPLHPRFATSGPLKRKTESVLSSESNAPKYRTRSMIIVYYDSAVQTAFESLVKFLSASRNSIRKAKMAARMLELKRIAELEAANDSTDDEDLPMGEDSSSVHAPALQTDYSGLTARRITHVEVDGEERLEPVQLEFKSTRRMGALQGPTPPSLKSTGYGRSEAGLIASDSLLGESSMSQVMDVYKDLEKDLQWCQAMCETAAHQFLRDGDCDSEIAAIKKKLSGIRTLCENEVARMEATVQRTKAGEEVLGMLDRSKMEGREMRSIQVRKSPSPAKAPSFNAMDLEVDSGVDEAVPKLPFVSSRDRARA